MPRASRYFVPGYIWHITHRCHKQEFLLKFLRDRKLWIAWLFEAKKRFGLTVFDYIVTSNHIHLLLEDPGGDAIPKSMQLIAGRLAQQYNLRKKRKGAFWEDRYHATAVDTGDYLSQCISYIDMNMVRAGVVKHPQQWLCCGYREIQTPPERYRIIDHERLALKLGFRSVLDFQRQHRQWIEQALIENKLEREAKWSQSIAVGDEGIVGQITEALYPKAGRREIVEIKGSHIVREPLPAYSTHFDGKIAALSNKNTHLWDLSID
jgi:putative transposase